MYKSGFTLIELLIVVAIIAILAAIAVPNFLEAQARAKVARARADHRTIATALESYRVDYDHYPRSNLHSWAILVGPPGEAMRPTLERLTSPIAYLSGIGAFRDPFKASLAWKGANLDQLEPLSSDNQETYHFYRYVARNDTSTAVWDDGDSEPSWYLLESAGTDNYYYRLGLFLNVVNPPDEKIWGLIYDATNGTVSGGSIWRAGGEPVGPGTEVFYAVMKSNG